MAYDLTKPTHGMVCMVQLTYGGGGPSGATDEEATVKRYACSESDVTTSDASVWTAMPELQVEYKQPLTAGIKKEEFKVTLERSVLPISVMITMTFPQVRVDVFMCDRHEAANPTAHQVTGGVIGQTKIRPSGKTKVVEAEVWRFKHLLDGIPFGVKATQNCPWILGDDNCTQTSNIGPYEGVVDAIDGQVISMAPGLPGQNTKHEYNEAGSTIGTFFRGYIEYDDLRLFIRSHRTTDDTGEAFCQLIVSDPPPTHTDYTWVGKTVRVYTGCVKTYTHCQKKFGNVEHFGAVGKMMPAYNPFMESPN